MFVWGIQVAIMRLWIFFKKHLLKSLKTYKKKYIKKGSFEGWIKPIMVNTRISYIRKNNIKNKVVELDSKRGSIEVDENNDSGILEHVNISVF